MFIESVASGVALRQEGNVYRNRSEPISPSARRAMSRSKYQMLMIHIALLTEGGGRSPWFL